MPSRLKTTLFLAALASTLVGCSFSQPAAPAGSHQPPQYILKFVPLAREGAVRAFFTLADAATNQMAAAGTLHVQVFSSSTLSLGDGSGGGMSLRRVFYDNTFAVGVTNFHWESHGGIFSVDDLAMRFVVPYENFTHPARQGHVVTVQIEFQPDNGTNLLATSRRVILY